MNAPPIIGILRRTLNPGTPLSTRRARALSAGKLHVTTVTPSALPHDVAGFLPYRAVVLENVPAGQAGPEALGALARFAADLGGGLLLTVLFPSAQAQQALPPTIPFESVANPLKLPPDMNFGEAAGVAVN